MDSTVILGPYPAHFHNYIHLVHENDLIIALRNQRAEAIPFFNAITEDKSKYRYSEGKWSIKQVMQHLSDTERVFTYRAMVFARKDENRFPSMDQDQYIKNSNADNRSWDDLVGEFFAVRKATQYLFESFDEESLASIGKAGSGEISVLAMGFTTVGHLTHHMNILRERYL